MTQNRPRPRHAFRQIVRGRSAKNLRKYITHGEMIGRKGKELVSIPCRSWTFRTSATERTAAAASAKAKGEPGEPSAPGEDRKGSGRSRQRSGPHILEVDVTLDELAEILGDELELPRIEPKGDGQHQTQERPRYNSIRRVGPESLRHFKPHLRAGAEAADRHRAAYEPPSRRASFRSRRQTISQLDSDPATRGQRAVIYMMDVSGSMTDDQKEIVRTAAFWIDTWLKSQYDGHRMPLHHPRRGRQRSSTSTPSITREKAAARGSARPTALAKELIETEEFP